MAVPVAPALATAKPGALVPIEVVVLAAVESDVAGVEASMTAVERDMAAVETGVMEGVSLLASVPASVASGLHGSAGFPPSLQARNLLLQKFLLYPESLPQIFCLRL